MGAAPTMPVELWASGWLSGLPTHTAAARLGVKPTVQLSRNACVVPVFAATCRPGSVRSPWQPNDRQRLRSSDMMAAMMYATSSLMGRYAFLAGSYVKTSLPGASLIDRTGAG